MNPNYMQEKLNEAIMVMNKGLQVGYNASIGV